MPASAGTSLRPPQTPRRRSWRRLTPWATTAAVPTTAAVRATGAPMTPRRAARAGRSGTSTSFGRLVGFERGEQGLDRNPPVGNELAARAAGGGGKRCRPGVFPDQHPRRRPRFHGGSEVHEVLGGEYLGEVGLCLAQLIDLLEVFDLHALDLS